jgi:hypothetical protein
VTAYPWRAWMSSKSSHPSDDQLLNHLKKRRNTELVRQPCASVSKSQPAWTELWDNPPQHSSRSPAASSRVHGTAGVCQRTPSSESVRSLSARRTCADQARAGRLEGRPRRKLSPIRRKHRVVEVVERSNATWKQARCRQQRGREPTPRSVAWAHSHIDLCLVK